MKFNFDENSTSLSITAYASGWVRIGEIRVESSCVVTPQAIHNDLLPADLASVNASHFERLLELSPEIVILGTGERQIFIDYNFAQALIQQHVGFEIMDTGAACRSFNILAAEDRAVVAALFMI